ncbi:hypothetical protein L596_023970 [Steinernema carpocapsae]|uniref:NAC-A/B domain-containing protein n=1 Tax=Steinernema carpocapsae TaxID=34508 RepID=A0A4U5MG08_STECR|nr:hypothetical protein L596_023970 [Steinernema carpocapsae]
MCCPLFGLASILACCNPRTLSTQFLNTCDFQTYITMEVQQEVQMETQANQRESKQSRAEKKARKLFQDLKMQPIDGVARVCFRKTKNILFVIEKPDVYRGQGTDVYIVFGEPRIEDLGQQAQMAAAQRLMPKENKTDAPVASVPSDDEDLDIEGLETKDIDLVMSQASCNRKKAIKALKENDNDIVNAIMSMTM